MRKHWMNRLTTIALAAALTLAQPVSALATGQINGSTDSGVAAGDVLTPAGGEPIVPGGDDVLDKINNPATTAGISTWDCVWFGKYWQDDTDGNGCVFSKRTTVSANGNAYYDEDGRRLYNFTGETGINEADDRKPVKWRVLSIDKETGEALLLSDKLLEKTSYNDVLEVTDWEHCTLRDYLNSTDDYSGEAKGFLNNAFNTAEKAAIENKEIGNPDNGGTQGGNATTDRIFCLALTEVVDKYGFGENDHWNNYAEATRTAFLTGYAAEQYGDSGINAGTPMKWWLRSPGKQSSTFAAYITEGGQIIYAGTGVQEDSYSVRPALRLNLKDHSDLWSYAGQVNSEWEWDPSLIANPFTYIDPFTNVHATTWHCVYFGNYWQDTDSNGDGKVDEKDTQDPIKWRVLQIDKDGVALLLSDKLIDIEQYNSGSTQSDTWSNCTLRSYLNGYGSDSNNHNKNYTSDNFILKAFSDAERKGISVSEVKFPENPSYTSQEEATTNDKLFCLSVKEALTSEYGFVKNEIKNSAYSGYTETDLTRLATVTAFAHDKEGFNAGTAGEAGEWWLRSISSTYHATNIRKDGSVLTTPNSYTNGTSMKNKCIRPALRINLKKNVNLWTYAGKVNSQTKKEADLSDINDPETNGDTTTWDCIYFGDYWQETDLNGDDKVTDTDPRDPIRWRVLDIDKDSGEVLLLSDTLLESADYEESSRHDVIWETCTLRSYLNGYGKDSNLYQKDYSSDSFLLHAFSPAERDAITVSSLENKDNPVYEMGGGENTYDKVFCLSIDEAMNSSYGFLKNEFTQKASSSDEKYNMTDNDNTRVADSTKYLQDNGNEWESWWLRTPAPDTSKYFYASVVYTSGVYSRGKVDAKGSRGLFDVVRPALRLNLKDHPDLWFYGGKVSSGRVPVTGITLSAQKLVLSVNQAVDLEAEIVPMYADNREVTWETSVRGVATVTPSEENSRIATVTGIERGFVTVSVISDEDSTISANCEIEVRQPVTGVSLSAPQSAVKPGDTIDLKPGLQVLPEDANEQRVTWESSAPDVATVENGVVTALKNGKTTIKVTTVDGGYTATCEIDVRIPVNGVSLPEKGEVYKGETLTLIPEFDPEDADDKTVTWTSSAPGTASVDENGVVTGLSRGKAVITVKTNDGGKTASCEVEVRVHVEKVELPATQIVAEHGTITLKPLITPADANDRTVTWISSAPDTAAVDENGVVTGKKKGKAVITVMTNDGGKTAGCEVTVAEILMLPGEVRRVSLSGNAFIYGVNWSVRYLTNDANGKPVKCVTVKNGVVTAKNFKKGQKSADAIVTAVYGTEMKEFNITVNGTAPENTFYQDGKKKVKLTAPKTLKLNVGDAKKKTVSIGIPALLRDPGKYTLSCSILTGGVCEVAGETFGEFDIDREYITFNKSNSKATVEVKPVNAGATYIVWGMEDENGKATQAVTRVLVKKPVSNVSVNQSDDGVTLAVGEGESLEVFTTEDNTDTKDVSFSVKPLANAAGKKVSGVKVSKSGFLMATLPDCKAQVTVKCGKAKPVTVNVTVSPWEGEGEYLTLKKTFINVKRPKTGSKTMPVEIANPKKQKDKAQPEIECFIDDEVPESEIRFGKDQKGRYSVSVSSTAKPGCYRVRTVAAEGAGDWNETGFELIVK